GSAEALVPFADMAPYQGLVGAKYRRSLSAIAATGMPLPCTDLGMAIFEELVPAAVLDKMTVEQAVVCRKKAESERSAFLEHVLALQAKLGQVPRDGSYEETIGRIVASEIRPAAAQYKNQLKTIWEGLLGKLAMGALGGMGTSAFIQLFGDLNWHG